MSVFERAKNYFFPAGYKAEAIALLKLASPAFATAFLLTSLLVINVLMSGRFGVTALNAVSLGNSILLVLGIDIGSGLSTACDTLFSQVFGSALKKRMGVLVQKSFYVMFMFIFPLAAIYLNMEPLLILAHQDPQVAWETSRYLMIAIPALFFYYGFLILARYMQTQNRMLPVLLAAMSGNVVSIALSLLFLYVFQLSYVFTAASFDIAVLCMAVASGGYIWLSKFYQPTWAGWSRGALYEISGFLKLGVGGLLMVALESWWIQITVLLAGIMGEDELGAQSVVMQYESLTYTLSEGLAIAVSVRVGQHAGANNVDGAWTTLWTALSFVPVVGTLVLVFYITLADHLPWLFTDDAGVAAIASDALPIVGVYFFLGFTVSALVGTVRGFGKQKVGAVVCFIGTYLVNVPIVMLLVFVAHWSIPGIWWGFVAGYLAQFLLYIVYLLRLDWQKACESSIEHISLINKPIPLYTVDTELQPPEYSASNSFEETDTEASAGAEEAVSESEIDPLVEVGQEKHYRPKFYAQVVRAIVIYGSAVTVFCTAAVYQFVFYTHDHSCAAHNCPGNYTAELAQSTVSQVVQTPSSTAAYLI